MQIVSSLATMLLDSGTTSSSLLPAVDGLRPFDVAVGSYLLVPRCLPNSKYKVVPR